MNEIRTRIVSTNVKGIEIEYEEKYVVNNTGEEIFDRDVEIENDRAIYNIYRKRKNLLTDNEIINIRKKYELNQKEYAKILGLGEITVHRFENGSIQTESVDSMMKLTEDPDNMAFLLIKNKDNITKELYNKIDIKIKELKQLKKHAIADINMIDNELNDFSEETAIIIAKNIINIYNEKIDELVDKYEVQPEYITNLKLQKLLYYVQALCLVVFDKKAFNEKIIAWTYGPVIKEIYNEFKSNKDKEIKERYKVKKLSEGLKNIIEEVINTYGKIDAFHLVELTHQEDPWKFTNIEEEIKIELIENYYKKIYNI